MHIPAPSLTTKWASWTGLLNWNIELEYLIGIEEMILRSEVGENLTPLKVGLLNRYALASHLALYSQSYNGVIVR